VPTKSVEKLSPEEYRQIINSPIAIPVNQKMLAEIKDPNLGLFLVRRIMERADAYIPKKIIS
jgi:hypothetical protein